MVLATNPLKKKSDFQFTNFN